MGTPLEVRPDSRLIREAVSLFDEAVFEITMMNPGNSGRSNFQPPNVH